MQSARSLLGLGHDANRDQIQAAWKKALRLTHPDLAPASQQAMAQQLSQQINEARDILFDELDAQSGFPARRTGSHDGDDLASDAANAWSAAQRNSHAWPQPPNASTWTRPGAHDRDAAEWLGSPQPQPASAGYSPPWYQVRADDLDGPAQTGTDDVSAAPHAGSFHDSPTVPPAAAGAEPQWPIGPETIVDEAARGGRRRTIVYAAVIAGLVVVVGGIALWLLAGPDTTGATAREDDAEMAISTAPVSTPRQSLALGLRSGTIKPSPYEQTRAVSPEEAFKAITFAVEQDDETMLQGLLDPSLRPDQAAEVVDLLSDSMPPWRLQQTRNSVQCRSLDDPSLAACAVTNAADVIPYEIEFRQRPGGWRLLGWST